MTAHHSTADLARARDAALAVHGELLSLVQREYEREHGRVESGLKLLRLVAEDPWFAWIRPLTAMVASVDEALVDPAPAMLGRHQVLLAALADLLRADETGSDFQRRYFAAIQASPDIAVAHRRAVQAMRPAPSPLLN
ncbi:MAG TPA: hypothetical protein VFN90_10760 [Gemmatimonadales bacterium]|nr:hypothetical protein [Gemmatimonadales bacterium]